MGALLSAWILVGSRSRGRLRGLYLEVTPSVDQLGRHFESCEEFLQKCLLIFGTRRQMLSSSFWIPRKIFNLFDHPGKW